ncbi:hypothetical protein T492DRAFT_842510 [Pavlovales sp. CCMP2436]|nr:hypothetical protein T492DRAFT_842510 [Pavlovales sp. CCMP2436]
MEAVAAGCSLLPAASAYEESWAYLALGEQARPGSRVQPPLINMAAGRDDAYAVTATTDSTLSVWCAETGVRLRILHGHAQQIFVCDTHPKRPDVVLSAGYDGVLILWDVTSGKQLYRYGVQLLPGEASAPQAVDGGASAPQAMVDEANGGGAVGGADGAHAADGGVVGDLRESTFMMLKRNAHVFTHTHTHTVIPHAAKRGWCLYGPYTIHTPSSPLSLHLNPLHSTRRGGRGGGGICESGDYRPFL